MRIKKPRQRAPFIQYIINIDCLVSISHELFDCEPQEQELL